MSDETHSPMPDDEPPVEGRPDDDKIGELLRRHAALYNEPPATPRESLWSRIEAERQKAAGSGGDAHVIPLHPRRNWWLGALAVAAVLALGIALGRISMRQEVERQGTAGPPVASVDAPADREPDMGAGETPEPAAGDVAVAADTTPEADAPSAAAAQQRDAPRRVTPGWAVPQQLAAAPSRPEPQRRKASASDLYRLASQQMLGQAEALLVQYRTDVAAERMDPAIARWAREVLTSTRLLLDSPAAEDPGMRDLLEDLELVLAQIVQRTGQADSLDDEMIDRTIEDRDLLPRLRGAIPAGIGAI
ncbi:MAG TPA: hypothetical protein VFS53_05015 [Gemmatimonadota bacterium]|nr:hypothetical protein [Gemmatimonadota bacterium]